jgi:hypothetical protein
MRSYLKNPSQKRAGGVAQVVGPEFKPQYCKKKKKCSEAVVIIGDQKYLSFTHC